MAEKEKTYRHEYKYLISAAMIPMLRARVAGLMAPDPHAENGVYTIRSVYFDDMDDRCFLDNAAGVDQKRKYRIRIYNSSDARILLERKEGLRGKKNKTSELLTRPQAEALLRGDYLRGGELLRKAGSGSVESGRVLPLFCADMMTTRMRPKVIVEYDRIPYVYRYGNVRVTFDTNISSSAETDAFFSGQIRRRPVMPAGTHLLEVKFDEFLPDVIYRALQLGTLRQTSFSKYYLSRIFS